MEATNNINMKYIIMCGGKYEEWETPRQLSKINGEEIVARTIRLLKENGIKDINISSNNPIFKKFGVPVLEHNNSYCAHTTSNLEGDWYDAFYPTDEPTCYLFGDVVFSPEAIKTIIETETNDMEFFGSKKPFSCTYIKTHEEPFALKVVNTNHLKDAISKTRELDKQGKFWRKPIMWELWTVIKDAPLQVRRDKYTAEYVGINDYTCDVDRQEDVAKLEKVAGGNVMIKVKAKINFTLERFNEIKNIVRAGEELDGKLFIGDVFECEEELANYLTGNNAKGIIAVDVIEIIPEIKKESEAVIAYRKALETDKENVEELVVPLNNETIKAIANGVVKEVKKAKRTSKKK